MHTTLLLEMASEAFPNRMAYGPRAGGISIAALAAHLASRGEGTVVFLGLNGPLLPIAIFAAGWLGRPFAPLNCKLLRRLLKQEYAAAGSASRSGA